MFGIGGSEILVILVVALLFLGPDKLPDAAKTISKGIRDLKKQSRALQNQIESDEQIGGAIRDLKSALRGDDFPARPPVRKEPPKPLPPEPTEAGVESPEAAPALSGAAVAAALTLPQVAGEPDPEVPDAPDLGDHDELGHLIKPAAGTIAKGQPLEAPAPVAPPAPVAAPAPAAPPAPPATAKAEPPPPRPRAPLPRPLNRPSSSPIAAPTAAPIAPATPEPASPSTGTGSRDDADPTKQHG